MEKIKFDFSQAVGSDELNRVAPLFQIALDQLQSKNGPGNDFLGWHDLPLNYDKTEFEKINLAASRLRENSEVFLVVGIGGSYLGAKAAIEFLSHAYYNQLPKSKRQGPEIYFTGTNISSSQLQDLIELIGDRDFSVNVISKSGTTTEPAIAFRILKQLTEKKYGKVGSRERIFATTDKTRGALKQLADQEGYQTFVVPDDVGGRYSVLTAVGLLPIAVAGISIKQLMEGAGEARLDLSVTFEKNTAAQYAACRHILYQKGKLIEMLVSYEPRCAFLAEWWKQLFGESDGKENKGLFPASASFTTDLHSLGQYIQEGRRHLFETVLNIEKTDKNLEVPFDPENLDGLNYIAGKSMDFVNKKAMEGTLMAHLDGGVPNLIITLPEASAFHLGYLFFFFEKACALTGYALGVNPFDQPGVEAYKKNMFKLLGKN